MNKDELNKLPPEERLKKLKELEEKAKKELEEAKKLMEETKVEILKEEMEENPAPSREDISHYLHPHEEGLEGAVAQAPRAAQQESTGYNSAFSQVRDMYSRLQEMSASDIMNQQQVQKVEEWYSNVNVILANAEKYQDQKVQEIAQASKRMIKELLGENAANVKYIP